MGKSRLLVKEPFIDGWEPFIDGEDRRWRPFVERLRAH